MKKILKILNLNKIRDIIHHTMILEICLFTNVPAICIGEIIWNTNFQIFPSCFSLRPKGLNYTRKYKKIQRKNPKTQYLNVET